MNLFGRSGSGNARRGVLASWLVAQLALEPLGLGLHLVHRDRVLDEPRRRGARGGERLLRLDRRLVLARISQVAELLDLDLLLLLVL